MAYELPAAGSTVDITLTFEASVVPYFDNVYASEKLDGETKRDFLERLIKQIIVHKYKTAITTTIATDSKQALRAEHAVLSADLLDVS